VADAFTERMDRKTAEDLLASYERLRTAMAEASAIMWSLPEDERREHLQAIGTLMQDLWLNLQRRVLAEHPELHPNGSAQPGNPQ
jgi:hypothetical protein